MLGEVVESVVGLDECPTCHGKDLDASPPASGETRRQLKSHCLCRTCRTSWDAVFRFVSIEEITAARR